MNLIQDEDIEALVEGMQNETIGRDSEGGEVRFKMNRVKNAIRILPEDATAPIMNLPSSKKRKISLWHPRLNAHMKRTLYRESMLNWTDQQWKRNDKNIPHRIRETERGEILGNVKQCAGFKFKRRDKLPFPQIQIKISSILTPSHLTLLKRRE